MYKVLLSATVLLLFAGCSHKTAYVPPSEFRLDRTTEESNATEIALGEMKTAKRDEALIVYEATTTMVHEITDIRFKALKDVVLGLPDSPVCRIEKDRIYIPSSLDASGAGFRIAIPVDDNSSAGAWITVDKEGRALSGKAESGVPNTDIVQAGEVLFAPEFKVLVHRQVDTVPQKRLKQELRYGGMQGDDIIIEFREYVDMAPDPVSAEILKYDLSASNVIRHRKFRLGVLYVDDDKIKYRVLGAPR